MEEQSDLYMKGREGPGKIVTNSKPGESAHNYGCATDWIVWDAAGKPVWGISDALWQEYGDICVKLGLRWGGNFKTFVDKPHNELPLALPWKKVCNIYVQEGVQGLGRVIGEHIIQ